MPIYAYRCGECGHELDTLQKISEPALRDCPSCGKPALAKTVTAAGFQLKGSGWYQTDFRSGSKPAATKDAASDGATDATRSETKGDTSSSKGDGSSTESAPAKGDPKPDTPPSSASAAGCGSGCSCH